MKCTLLAAALLAFLTPTALRAQTQSEMNAEAYRDFTTMDARMNGVYAEVMKALPDDEARAKLKTSQRAWLVFRDAEADLEADFSRGGSISRMDRANSLTALTEARIAQLKKVLEPR